jgi:hypothetical protein
MRRIFSLAALSLLALTSTASAQRSTRSGGGSSSANPSPELGVDAGVTFTLDDPKVTTFSVPIQSVRAGFFLSPEISLEPSLAFQSLSVSGGSSGSAYAIGLGLLYHFSTSRAANQMYVRPFIGLDGTSGGGSSTNSFSFGGGFGVKVPVGTRFATRFEGNLAHRSDSGVSQNAIGLLAGLSVYTR